MPDPLWDFDAEGKPRHSRRALVRALAWPDELAEQDRRDEEADAQDSALQAKAHGFGVSDQQWADSWQAYQRALAERGAKEEQPPQDGAPS
jgi:hypothetical protein